MVTLKPTFHEDGTITYFSLIQRRWQKRIARIPAEDLAQFDGWERRRVLEHLATKFDIVIAPDEAEDEDTEPDLQPCRSRCGVDAAA